MSVRTATKTMTAAEMQVRIFELEERLAAIPLLKLAKLCAQLTHVSPDIEDWLEEESELRELDQAKRA